METRRRKSHPFSKLFRRNKETPQEALRQSTRDGSNLDTGPAVSEPCPFKDLEAPKFSGKYSGEVIAESNPSASLTNAPAGQVADRVSVIAASNAGELVQQESRNGHNNGHENGTDNTSKTEGKPSFIGSRSYSAPAIHYSEGALHKSESAEGSDRYTKLWDEAYDELKRIEPELVKAYEKILSKDYEDSYEAVLEEENIIEQGDRTRRRLQMDRILRNTLQQTTTLPAGTESRVSSAISVVQSLKLVLDNGLQPVPIAAVAWSGVCIGLQLISATIAEQQARNTGVVDIALKMKWYSSLSQIILDDRNKKLANLRSSLPDGIVDLYVKILQFLFKCICAAYKGRAQIFKDMLRLDGLEAIQRETQEKELSFRNVIRDYSDERKASYLELLVDLCRSTAEDEILRKLFVVNMKSEVQSLQHRKDDLIPESSNWILTNEVFLRFSNWVNDNRYRRLWIKGKAGMGKTMLVIGIIKQLGMEFVSQQETRFDSPYLSYFFCQGTNGKLNTATAVVRGLIWMFLRQENSLIQHAMCLAGQTLDNDLSTFLDLKNILFAMLRSPVMKRVYIIIDALDECVETSRSHGIPGRSHLLEMIAEIARDFPNVKCLASSRDEMDIEMKLSRSRDADWEPLQLELSRNLLSGPIEAYINNKMSALEAKYLAEWEFEGEVDESDRELIHSKLQTVTKEMYRKADGTFLWVALIFLRIDDERTDLRELPRLVNETPEKLEEIYENMKIQIQASKDGNSQLCKRALAIATTANRPLRLAEMRLLADFPREVSPLKILKLCRFFRITEDNDGQKSVYMIHQSAKQWLEQQLRSGLLDAFEGPDHLATAHASLAESCLRVLNSTLKRNIWKLPHPGIEIDQIQAQSEVKQPSGPMGIRAATDEHGSAKREVFAPNPAEDALIPSSYAALNWFDHLSKVSTRNLGPILTAVLKFMTHHFLHWLEALSLLRRMDEGAIIISHLARFVEATLKADEHSSTLKDLAAIVNDANRFILYFRDAIESAPLQVYAAGLEFSPMKSRIKDVFKAERPAWITTPPRVEDYWSPCLQTLEKHEGSVFSVAFSPDGQRLASGSHDRTVRIWVAETGTLHHTLHGHRDWVSSVTFSHDGKLLASGSHDKSVKIWDAETGASQQTLLDHQDLVSSVAFSPCGNRLASGSYDGMVHIYDPISGLLCRSIKASDVWIMSVSFSYDGKTLALGLHDGHIGVWNAESGLQQSFDGRHASSVTSVVFSQDSKRIASGSHDKSICIWDVTSGRPLQKLGDLKSPILSLAFSSDGNKLAFGSRDDLVRIWDAQANNIKATLKGHRNSVLSIAFSPDGGKLASGSQDRKIRIWETETEAAQQNVLGRASSVSALALSQSGKYLGSGSYDNSIRIWDCETGLLYQVLTGHANSVSSLTFSADGKYLASASHDKTVRIWHAESWKPLHTLKGHKNSVFAVSFSHDGKLIASGSHDKSVRIWWTATGEIHHMLAGHGNSISSVAFSPDGKLVVSGSHDKTVRVWDVESGVLQQTLSCVNSIFSVAFSSNGRKIAVGEHGGTVTVRELETDVVEYSIHCGISSSTLSFAEDGSGVVTERGYISFQTLTQTSQSEAHSPYSVLEDNSWVTWQGQKLLWIPWEYRPVCLMVRNCTLAIGCTSGRVLLLRFGPSAAPR